MNRDRFDVTNSIGSQLKAVAQESFRRIRNQCDAMPAKAFFTGVSLPIDTSKNNTLSTDNTKTVDQFTKTFDNIVLMESSRGGYEIIGIAPNGLAEERLSRTFDSYQQAKEYAGSLFQNA
jgi:hypothetical protein